jgi:2'-5' RNA ligase
VGVEAAPLIVSALLGDADFAWLDGLRKRHFPPERNVLAAHLTLFHHLPPSCADELKQRLSELTSRQPRPQAEARAILDFGGGTAIGIASPALAEIRGELANQFSGLLTPQDRAGWRPHVTIQNKVSRDAAKSVQAELRGQFRPKPVVITALAAWHYRGGPWELSSRHAFA